jgi:hypothetical protein
MNFFVDTAFGYSNNQREATLLQNVSSKIWILRIIDKYVF